MNIIPDPLFYVLAIPAILALGLGKGGFAGVGMISTPLLALTMPPLQAAAILLPILLFIGWIGVYPSTFTGLTEVSVQALIAEVQTKAAASATALAVPPLGTP